MPRRAPRRLQCALSRDLRAARGAAASPARRSHRIIAYHATRRRKAAPNSAEDLEDASRFGSSGVPHRLKLRKTHSAARIISRMVASSLRHHSAPGERQRWVDIQKTSRRKTLAAGAHQRGSRGIARVDRDRQPFPPRRDEMLEERIQRLMPNEKLAVHLVDLDYFKAGERHAGPRCRRRGAARRSPRRMKAALREP